VCARVSSPSGGSVAVASISVAVGSDDAVPAASRAAATVATTSGDRMAGAASPAPKPRWVSQVLPSPFYDIIHVRVGGVCGCGWAGLLTGPAVRARRLPRSHTWPTSLCAWSSSSSGSVFCFWCTLRARCNTVPRVHRWIFRQIIKVTTTPGLIVLLVVGVWYLGYTISRMLVFAGSSGLVLRQVQQDCTTPLARRVMNLCQAASDLVTACLNGDSMAEVQRAMMVRREVGP